MQTTYIDRLRIIADTLLKLDTGHPFTGYYEELDILVNNLTEGAALTDTYQISAIPFVLAVAKRDTKTTINIAVHLIAEIYPLEPNELCAVRRYRATLDQSIKFKERMNIKAADERDLYDFLYEAEQVLIKNSGWLPGLKLGGNCAPQL